MSDLILSLPHYHRHYSDLRSAYHKHDFRPYMFVTGFYIAVRCGFDKHLYLISCLNAHNQNIRLPQTGCTAR